MAEKNIGLLLSSTLRPEFQDLTFPIAFSKELKGGLHTVTSSTNLKSPLSKTNEGVPVNRREWGMLVFTYNEEKIYQLLPRNSGTPDLSDDDNFVELTLGGGSSEWVDSVKGVYNDPGNISPSPTQSGTRFLVGSSGAGSFSGQSNKIATYYQYLNSFQGGYLFSEVPDGVTLRVDNQPNTLYNFRGTSSQTGVWNKELLNTVRYIYPTSNNGLTFSFTTTEQSKITGYTYCLFLANFATSNSGSASLSIDGATYAPIKKVSSGILTDLSSGDFAAGVEYHMSYDQGVFQILLPSSGQGGTIGPAEDDDYTDGLYTDFDSSTPIGTPIDRFNQILKALVPPPAPNLNSWSVSPQDQFVTGRISYTHAQEPGLPSPMVSVTFSDYGDVTKGQSYTKGDQSGYRLGIRSKVSQPTTTDTYYQNILGVLNSGVSANPNLPTPAYGSYSFGNGITGSLVLYLNSITVSSVDLGSTTNAIDTTGGVDGGFNLSAATNSKFSNGTSFESFWHRTGTYQVNRTSANINSGFNKISVKHFLPTSTITLSSYEFLSDPETSQTSYASAVPTYNLSGLKYLSGVAYYTSGSIGYSVVVSNVYKNTYYSGSDAGTFQDVTTANTSNIYNGGASYDTNSTAVVLTPTPATVGLTEPTQVTDTFQFQSSFGILSGKRKVNGTSTIRTQVKRTVQGTTTGGSLSLNNLFIDTVSTSSTNISEDFNDEAKRLPNGNYNLVSDITSSTWTSASSLLSVYRNALQVADGRLLYPFFNFSQFTTDTNPNAGNSDVNYTSCKTTVVSPIHGLAVNGYRTYTRWFNLGNTSYARFTLNMTWVGTVFKTVGTALTNATDCYLEFKLPYNGTNLPSGGLINGSVTGWLDASKDFSGTAVLSDGAGCRGQSQNPSSGSSWSINFGARETGNSSGYVLMRITAGKDWSGYIESITLTPP